MNYEDTKKANGTPTEEAPKLWRSILVWVGGFLLLVVLATLLTWLGVFLQR